MKQEVIFKPILMAVVPPIAAITTSITYPFLWGPFALGQTVLTIMSMVLLAGVGITTCWFWVAPVITRMASISRARWFASGVLVAIAVAITTSAGLFVVLSSRTPEGTPVYALVPPVAMALGVALSVYVFAVIGVCFKAVSLKAQKADG